MTMFQHCQHCQAVEVKLWDLETGEVSQTLDCCLAVDGLDDSRWFSVSLGNEDLQSFPILEQKGRNSVNRRSWKDLEVIFSDSSHQPCPSWPKLDCWARSTSLDTMPGRGLGQWLGPDWFLRVLVRADLGPKSLTGSLMEKGGPTFFSSLISHYSLINGIY